MRIKYADEWGWSDPVEEPEIDIEQPDVIYTNDETAAAATYLVDNTSFNKKTTKRVQKQLQRTRNPDLIHNELITTFMDTLVNGAHNLGAPYNALVLKSLENVDWDQLASVYTTQVSGPKYLDEGEELSEVDQLLHTLSEQPQTPSSGPSAPDRTLQDWFGWNV